jgi:tripartite-type tricarboxylate transporter receptor subunit TctC
MGRFSLCHTCAAAAVLALTAAPVKAADPIADFYTGKTITIIVSSAAGGTYDAHARLLSRHLPKFMPGHPQVVVQNMAGAGGMTAANHLYNVAAKDGTIIGVIQANVPFEPFYGSTEAKFDAKKFNWLASPTKETRVFALWHEVPVNTIEEAQKRELIMGATGVNSTPALYARVFQAIFDLKIKLVPGYTSQSEALLAMERREADGFPSPSLSSLMVFNPAWVKEKKLKFLFQYGAEPHPDLPGVPYAFDLIKDPETKTLARIAAASEAISRPFLMPPDVPAERVAALRKAIFAAYADPAYKAECAKERMDCDSPTNHQEMQEIMERTYTTPPRLRDRLVEMYKTGK